MTGIELIAQERAEQIEKHGRTIENDAIINNGVYEIEGETFYVPQLAHAAHLLVEPDGSMLREQQYLDTFIPHGWDKEIWDKIVKKPYKERLIIAGALIAAEIDRLNYKDANQ